MLFSLSSVSCLFGGNTVNVSLVFDLKNIKSDIELILIRNNASAFLFLHLGVIFVILKLSLFASNTVKAVSFAFD